MSDIHICCQLPRSDDFTLDVNCVLPGRGVSAISGHSGSGKTTLLRYIAGLEAADAGHNQLSIGDQSWQSAGKTLAPHRRKLGYVFQEASLFDHLSVEGNISYGRRRSQQPLAAHTLKQLYQVLGIEHLLQRPIQQLSGGEQQRVAIARALAGNPQILLMDEPLSAIDQARKQELLSYLESLFRWLDIPVLYVTHSMAEVSRLADHLLVLEHGSVIRQGPANRVLAELSRPQQLGIDGPLTSIWLGYIEAHDEMWQLSQARFGEIRLHLPQAHQLQPGDSLRLAIEARDVSLSLTEDGNSSIQNRLAGRIEKLNQSPDAPYADIALRLSGQRLWARVTRKACHELALQPGMLVWAQIKATSILP